MKQVRIALLALVLLPAAVAQCLDPVIEVKEILFRTTFLGVRLFG